VGRPSARRRVGVLPVEGQSARGPQPHRGHRQGDPRQQSDSLQLLEVENINAVRLLNDEYLKGCGYVVYLNDSKDTSTGQDIGLLTRVDPRKTGSSATNGKVAGGTVPSRSLSTTSPGSASTIGPSRSSGLTCWPGPTTGDVVKPERPRLTLFGRSHWTRPRPGTNSS